jgi:hypothetical protein
VIVYPSQRKELLDLCMSIVSMAPWVADSRRRRTLAASVVLLFIYIATARAQQSLCNGATTEGICKANGVGVWCNPCDSATYVVCRLDAPSKLEKCGEGEQLCCGDAI